jgi:hypothetical protein
MMQWHRGLIVVSALVALLSGCGAGDGPSMHDRDAGPMAKTSPDGPAGTSFTSGFTDVMFMTMDIPVERRILALTTRPRMHHLLPPGLLGDLRTQARSRLALDVHEVMDCGRLDACRGEMQHLTLSMWRHQDRYLPRCRLAPPATTAQLRPALRCALAHAKRLSRYEMLNGLSSSARRSATVMHGESSNLMSRLCRARPGEESP